MSDETSRGRIDRAAILRIASILEQQGDPDGQDDRRRLAARMFRVADGGDLRDLAEDPEAQLIVDAFTVPDGEPPATDDPYAEPADVPAGEVAAVLDRLAVLARTGDPVAAGAEPRRPVDPGVASAAKGDVPEAALAPAEPRYRRAGLVFLFGSIGALLLALASVELAIYYLFLGGPLLLVAAWFAEILVARRPLGLRAPQTAGEWAGELSRATDRIRGRAQEFGTINGRVGDLDDMLADLQRRCRRAGAGTPARQVASMRRQLGAVQQNTRMLEVLLTDGCRAGAEFAERWHDDPAAACADFGQLPYAIDPGRIAELTRPVVLVLCLCADTAADVVLEVSGRTATTAGEVAEELAAIAELARRINPRIRSECRTMIRAADNLHSVVTVVAIDKLRIRHGAKRMARAAVAASALTRSVRNRATIRAVFIREISHPAVRTGRGRPPIGRATVVAISRGRPWRTTPTDLAS